MSRESIPVPWETTKSIVVNSHFKINSEYRFVNAGLAIFFFILIIIPFFIGISEKTAEKSLRFIKLPPCAIEAITGRPCPSCGITRSIVSLYQGKLKLSRDFHPAGYLVVLWLVFQLFYRVRFIWTKMKWWFPWADIGQIMLSGIIFRNTI